MIAHGTKVLLFLCLRFEGWSVVRWSAKEVIMNQQIREELLKLSTEELIQLLKLAELKAKLKSGQKQAA